MTNNPKGLNQYTGKSKAGGSFAKKTPLSGMSEIGDSIRAKQAKDNSVNTARLQANAARQAVRESDSAAKTAQDIKGLTKVLPKSIAMLHDSKSTQKAFEKTLNKESAANKKALYKHEASTKKFGREYIRGTSNKALGQKANNADETLRFANRSQSSRKK